MPTLNELKEDAKGNENITITSNAIDGTICRHQADYTEDDIIVETSCFCARDLCNSNRLFVPKDEVISSILYRCFECSNCQGNKTSFCEGRSCIREKYMDDKQKEIATVRKCSDSLFLNNTCITVEVEDGYSKTCSCLLDYCNDAVSLLTGYQVYIHILFMFLSFYIE